MYDFNKNSCDKCFSKGELILGYDGSALCEKCHKEDELRKIFELEDNVWSKFERKIIAE
jgi:hypothetical protein